VAGKIDLCSCRSKRVNRTCDTKLWTINLTNEKDLIIWKLSRPVSPSGQLPPYPGAIGFLGAVGTPFQRWFLRRLVLTPARATISPTVKPLKSSLVTLAHALRRYRCQGHVITNKDLNELEGSLVSSKLLFPYTTWSMPSLKGYLPALFLERILTLELMHR
jgi:hypothetical protein